MNTLALKRFLVGLPMFVRKCLQISLVFPARFYIRFAPWTAGKSFLWHNLADHLWWLESRVKATTKSGIQMWVDASDIVGKFIYYFGLWEPSLTMFISKRLKPGDVFIDVGANIGYFTLLASKLVGPTGKVVAIEALPDIANTLRENLMLNNAQNVRVENAAAWNNDEILTFYTHPVHLAGTTTCRQSWAHEWGLVEACKIRGAVLSVLLTREEIAKARLVKVDVEGAEWQALEGISTVIGEFRREVEFIVEVNFKMLKEQGRTPSELFQMFNRWGFDAYEMANDYSADTYLGDGCETPLKRLQAIGETNRTQMDVLFSRTDKGLVS